MLLVDQKDAPGGMRNTAYDSGRLHKPHPMFTVGDIEWKWRQSRQYLAARDEVQSNLCQALARAGRKMDVTLRFATTASGCVDVDTPQGPMARIELHPKENPA
ncbi:hypothetical protein POI8812_01039 [Pontivivens insulae]|uniref:Uncharacterized protein n=1 Tax=Pontivivens insulae TaxID=1639689 RepID=A0A2R8A942_9RHOB|nr:hypothetical protein DFR53_1038 [Pontivivens insulae]SPF28736.1 hypothetical protein POI8812_01039 [Pontivivens insulae]